MDAEINDSPSTLQQYLGLSLLESGVKGQKFCQHQLNPYKTSERDMARIKSSKKVMHNMFDIKILDNDGSI